MRLYNTLTQEIEAFPSHDGTVTVYVCGITPYDATHLGHAFTYTALDVIIRYLEYLGRPVLYVQNVTDVDDDILRKAAEVDENWKALGDRWTARFIRDMIALNVRPPDRFPRATDAIPEIIGAVKQLQDAELAYESGGNVYFHVEDWPSYGRLSRLAYEEMLPIANERGNDPDDVNKQDPLDFVLWQSKAPGEPSWESPWGLGRPGWHIECSTMAVQFLGVPIDLHSGGADLEFPHHESEIAQAEGATEESPFARHWVHTAMVRHEGEKMSKSIGNLVMVKDLLEDWTPDALRLYLACHHYRKPWSHDKDELEQAEARSRTLEAAVSVKGGNRCPVDAEPLKASFLDAMDDDLDTPLALTHLERLAQATLRGADEDRDVEAAQRTLRVLGSIFGLRLGASDPDEGVAKRWKDYLADFT